MPTLYGRSACQCMIKSMPMIEARLRALGAIKTNLAGMIGQGAYSRGSLSADTHAGGGAIDVAYSLVDTNAKVLAWRRSGVAMWPRTGVDSPKFSAAVNNMHGHGIWIGCPHVSAGAAEQVQQYRAGGDGLIGPRPDRFPQPKIVTWQQALSAWQKTPAGAGGTAPTQGDDDMPHYTPWTATKKKQATPAGKWTTIQFSDKDTSFLHESHDADGYIPELHFTIDGPKLGPDDYVSVRTVRMDAKGKVLDSSPVTTFATSEVAYTVPGRAGKDVKVRVQVNPRISTSVVYAGGRSIYWKA